MRIDKTIMGEKYSYYIKFLPDTMTANVRYFQSDDPVKAIISNDFKYLVLPDDFMSPYISGVGKVAVKKLKLPRHMQADAKDYNEKYQPQ